MDQTTLPDRPRLLVLTDIGGDPDDEQTLVRLLVHANEFDVEGIIPEHWRGSGHRQTPGEQMALVQRYLGAYGQVRANLREHAAGYPTEAHLHAVLRRGKMDIPFALDRRTMGDVTQIIGSGLDTEGSEWIIGVVDRPDPRPVDVTVWGGRADLAPALWRVRYERSAAGLDAFVAKIRVHTIGDQDDTGPWIRKHFPGLFYLLDHSRDGDTPSWFYFCVNGLNVPAQPGFGGWGGRFAPHGAFYQDTQDAVGDETSGRATVWRWRPEYQNEFQARMDWCVRSYGQANHKPLAVVNGDSSRQMMRLFAAPGERLHLDAAGSSDPDSDTLAFRWWVIPQAGTYGGDIEPSWRAQQKGCILFPSLQSDRVTWVLEGGTQHETTRLCPGTGCPPRDPPNTLLAGL